MNLADLIGYVDAALADGEVVADLPVFAIFPDSEPVSESTDWYQVAVVGVELDDDGDDEVDVIVDSDSSAPGLDVAGFRSALEAMDSDARSFEVYLRGEWEDLGDDEWARIDRPLARFVSNSERTVVGLMPAVDEAD